MRTIKNESKQVKVDKKWAEEISRIISEKDLNGTMKKIPMIRRGMNIVTEKMLKADNWEKLKEELIKRDFELDKDEI